MLYVLCVCVFVCMVCVLCVWYVCVVCVCVWCVCVCACVCMHACVRECVSECVRTCTCIYCFTQPALAFITNSNNTVHINKYMYTINTFYMTQRKFLMLFNMIIALQHTNTSFVWPENSVTT